MLAAADRILRGKPADLRALSEKASALADLGEQGQELEVRARILELAKGDLFAETVVAIAAVDPRRLSALGTLRRVREAESLQVRHPEAAQRLLESVVDGRVDDPLQPDALLALAILVRDSDPERSRTLLLRLDEDYPLHAAADLARAKGLLP